MSCRDRKVQWKSGHCGGWLAAGGSFTVAPVGVLLPWTRKNLERTFLDVLSISKAFLFLGH